MFRTLKRVHPSDGRRVPECFCSRMNNNDNYLIAHEIVDFIKKKKKKISSTSYAATQKIDLNKAYDRSFVENSCKQCHSQQNGFNG